MRIPRPSSALLFVVGLVLFFGGLNAVQRWQTASVEAYVHNLDQAPHTLRIVDRWSGRVVAVGTLRPGELVLAHHGRWDEWWVGDDAATGRRHGIGIEVLADGCELVATSPEWLGRGETPSGAERIVIEAGGRIASSPWPHDLDRAAAPELRSVSDPCPGTALVPRGQIVNATVVPVSVGHGVVVAPCDAVIVRPGDLPDGSLPEPIVPPGVVRVTARSIDAQDERWPMEPRSVLVTPTDVVDDLGPVDPYELERCREALERRNPR